MLKLETWSERNIRENIGDRGVGAAENIDNESAPLAKGGRTRTTRTIIKANAHIERSGNTPRTQPAHRHFQKQRAKLCLVQKYSFEGHAGVSQEKGKCHRFVAIGVD